MQNVYDLAHELARSLKETDQYKDYQKYKAQIDANEDLRRMVDDFTLKNMQVQTAMMSGQTPDQELVDNAQEIYFAVMQDPTCAQFLNAEMAFSTIVSDIYKILGEAMQ